MNVSTSDPPNNDEAPQSRDLVIVCAGDTYHPAVEYWTINPSYIVFGIIRSYTYIKWSSKRGREHWNIYTNNYKRLDVEWEPVIS